MDRFTNLTIRLKPGLQFASVLILIFLARATFAQQLSVKPAYLEIDLSKKRPSGSLIVTNTGDKEIRCRAQTLYWRLSVDGLMEIIPPDERSLAPWIKFNPREFTLAPKSSQHVRYSIIPRGQLEPGEYWGGIEFEPLLEKMKVQDDAKNVSATVTVITSILVPIYGRYGDYEVSAALDSLTAVANGDSIFIRSIVENNSPGGLRLGGNYEILDSTGNTIAKGKLSPTFILPLAIRRVSAIVKKAIQDGRYTLKLNLLDRQTNQPLVSGETLFEVGTHGQEE